jgi:DNA-binding NarL/FixJ family response regulator
MTVPTRVWLVEDNDAYRQVVSRVVDAATGLTCPAAFDCCEAALAALADTSEPPDIVLLDIGLPGMSGLDALPSFRAAVPAARLIVLTVFEDDDKIFRALCAGAHGYLLKVSTVDEITAAIRQVRDGGAPINARIARRVIEMFAKLAPAPGDYGLTGRERGVLDLLVRGLIKKKIAARLGLSIHTVDSHVRNIYDKLQVHTRSGAVAKAVQEKLV